MIIQEHQLMDLFNITDGNKTGMHAFWVLHKSIIPYINNKSLKAFPSRKTIATNCSLSLTSVDKALEYLAEKNVIKIEKRYDPITKIHKSSLYSIDTDLIKTVGNLKSSSSTEEPVDETPEVEKPKTTPKPKPSSSASSQVQNKLQTLENYGLNYNNLNPQDQAIIQKATREDDNFYMILSVLSGFIAKTLDIEVANIGNNWKLFSRVLIMVYHLQSKGIKESQLIKFLEDLKDNTKVKQQYKDNPLAILLDKADMTNAYNNFEARSFESGVDSVGSTTKANKYLGKGSNKVSSTIFYNVLIDYRANEITKEQVIEFLMDNYCELDNTDSPELNILNELLQ